MIVSRFISETKLQIYQQHRLKPDEIWTQNSELTNASSGLEVYF